MHNGALWDIKTLRALQVILTNYAEISGLECNVEKTTLVQVGDKSQPTAEILELGFDIRVSVTVLGMVIENDTGDFSQNIEKTLDKVRKQIRFWSAFSLSLPGRILITKTMLYSQVNYLGGFLPYSSNSLRPIEEATENFVKGNVRLPKSRIYDEPTNGGLGLFRLEHFLKAQNCSWIMRAQVIDDNWKHNLFAKSFGCIYNVRPKYFDSRYEQVPTIRNRNGMVRLLL